MRILLVSDHYPPGIGGAERQTWLLARTFAGQGHDVAVAVPWYKGSPRSYDDEGVAVFRVRQLRTALTWLVRDSGQRHAPPFPDPVTIRELRHLIKQFRPDVVNSHGWMTYSCAVVLVRNKIPLLVTARDYGYFCANRTLLHDGAPCRGPELLKCLGCAGRYFGVPKGWFAVVGVLAGRPLLRRSVSGFHSISNYVSLTMQQHLFASDVNGRDRSQHVDQFVIPNFRQEALEPVVGASYLKALPTSPFILFVGALRHAKGIGVLLEAYARLDAPPPLVLIGTYDWDGPVEFPQDVTVLTEYPHEAVMAAWDHALFGVMPSLLPEPLGAVVHEAMSRGKPVIATSHGGSTDMIIDGETGVLVPPGDVVALVSGMEGLLSDPERRERLGRAARERARLFTAEVVVPQYLAAYEAVSGKGAAKSPGD